MRAGSMEYGTQQVWHNRDQAHVIGSTQIPFRYQRSLLVITSRAGTPRCEVNDEAVSATRTLEAIYGFHSKQSICWLRFAILCPRLLPGVLFLRGVRTVVRDLQIDWRGHFLTPT